MDSTPAATDDLPRRFRKWAAITTALAVLGWIAYAMVRGFGEVAEQLQAFAWPIYIPVLLLTLVNYGLRYLKWHYLLGKLGVHVPHKTDLPIFIAGLAMVISPGKAGELLKPYLIGIVTGEPMTRTVPALVAERATDGIAVLALAAVGVSTFYSEGASALIGLTVAIIGLLVVLAAKPLSLGILRTVGRVPLLTKLALKAEDTYLAMRVCLAPVPLFWTVAVSLVAWWAECLGFWLVLEGLGVTSSLNLATFLYAFSTVAGGASPGGLGVTDVLIAELALPLIPGMLEGQALAASLLIRVATLWFGVILGAICLLWMERILAAAPAVAPSPEP